MFGDPLLEYRPVIIPKMPDSADRTAIRPRFSWSSVASASGGASAGKRRGGAREMAETGAHGGDRAGTGAGLVGDRQEQGQGEHGGPGGGDGGGDAHVFPRRSVEAEGKRLGLNETQQHDQQTH